jgi:broad specificity phosphatase PhoE
MKLYLLRHAETDWNRGQRLQGTTDVPLNEAGTVQARRLAERFREVRLSAVFTSPLARARHTALIVSQVRELSTLIEGDLREIDHGIWTGMTSGTIARRFPDEFAIWRFLPDRLQLSSGERLQEAYRRAVGFLSRLLRMRVDGNVLIVSHGVINALLICAVLGMPLERIWELPQPNGCLHVLRFRNRQVVDCKEIKNVAD